MRGWMKTAGVPRWVVLILAMFLVACEDTVTLPVTGNPDRTVLLYILGDNSLSDYAEKNIQAIQTGMADVNSTLDMLVYQDDLQGSPSLWHISAYQGGPIEKRLVCSYEEQDSTDPAVIGRVLSDAYGLFPAAEKGLILWSHGSGWLPSPAWNPSRTIGPDDDSYLELWDLRAILEQTGLHFSFIAFDACLMGGVEVAYELRELTDYLVLSPTEIKGIGFPYQYMVPVLCETDLDLIAFCDAYMQYYTGKNGRDGAISLVATEALDSLAACYKEILALVDLPSCLDNRVIQQMGRRIPYTTTSYKDIFFDMGDLVKNLLTPYDHTFERLMEKRVVLYKNNTTRFDTFEIYRNSGLTVFIPELCLVSSYRSAYPLLQWYRDTR